MIQPLEIHNLLHNYQPNVALQILKDKYPQLNEDFLEQALNRVHFVREEYTVELENGANFSQVYTAHFIAVKRDGTPPNQRPPMMKRAQNFGRALFKFVVAGLPVESREEAKKKLAICESNECGFYDGSVCTHTECGCFSKIKTFFETEHCPINKW